MRLVLSDTHIGDDRGDRHLASLLKIIERHAAPDSHLILNGDIFDLASCLSMDSRHEEFIETARLHGKVTYIEGNHDWFIRGFGKVLSRDLEFVDELRLEIGGRKFRIMHGHQYDIVANHFPRTNRFLIRFNHMLRRFLDVDFQMVLRNTGLGKRLLTQQEKRIVKREKWADVVVTGHTHHPMLARWKNRTYVNTGDWVERSHRAYLLIHADGSFEFQPLT